MALSEVFYMSLITTGAGLCAGSLATCYKSKCQKISLCCGLFVIDRDISAEINDHRLEMNQRNNNQSFSRSPADLREFQQHHSPRRNTIIRSEQMRNTNMIEAEL